MCRLVTCISKGACSGPVELTAKDRAIALSAGSIDDLRVQLVQAAHSDRNGGDWARGIHMLPSGTWRALYCIGKKKTIMRLRCASKEVAQELRDACCIIMGNRWVAGSQLTQPAGPAFAELQCAGHVVHSNSRTVYSRACGTH